MFYLKNKELIVDIDYGENFKYKAQEVLKIRIKKDY